MDVRVELHLQFDIQLQQTLLQLIELLGDVCQLGVVIVAGDQADLLNGSRLEHCLAEADKVLNLVRQANVWILNNDGLRTLKIRPHDRPIAITGIAIEDGEVLLLELGRWWLNRRQSIRRGGGRRRHYGSFRRGRSRLHSGLRFSGPSRFIVHRFQTTTRWLLGSWCISRLRAEHHHFFTAGLEVGQINACKLVIWFALVHLLLDAAATLRRYRRVFLTVVVGRRLVLVQYLHERTVCFFGALFVASLNGVAESCTFAPSLIPVRVLELVVAVPREVLGDESVVIRQELRTVLRH